MSLMQLESVCQRVVTQLARILSMRWDRLFDDLEAQLSADRDAELVSEVADRTRRERALVGLHERLVAARNGRGICVSVVGLGGLQGAVLDVGSDWLLLRTEPERDQLVPLAAVMWVSGLAGRIAPPSSVARSFGFGSAVRVLSRDRAVVTLSGVDGGRHTGTIDAVHADAFDLAVHASDVPRRAANVLDVRTVPFAAVAAVTRA